MQICIDRVKKSGVWRRGEGEAGETVKCKSPYPTLSVLLPSHCIGGWVSFFVLQLRTWRRHLIWKETKAGMGRSVWFFMGWRSTSGTTPRKPPTASLTFLLGLECCMGLWTQQAQDFQFPVDLGWTCMWVSECSSPKSFNSLLTWIECSCVSLSVTGPRFAVSSWAK